MAFLTFDKAELVNLEYSLSRESLRSNRAGSYASTTISGCNTRKYHGLLICPVDQLDGERHVLLSTLDVTVIQHGKEFNLGIHKFEGDLYVPRGHKYIRDYDAEKGSRMTYRVGGVVLTREMMLVKEKEQILVKLTLEDAHSDTIIRVSPFLAFRNIHQLSKANMYLNRQYMPVENGIKSRMYEGYPDLFMQFSKKIDFVPVPDWYYNLEYLEEQRRGYDYKEDLYVPGYFEFPIRKGESVIFSASTAEEKSGGLKRKFSAESASRIPLESYHNCLLNSAQQFAVRREGFTGIQAGYPWQGIRSRETFTALPGLTMVTGDTEFARAVINSMVLTLNDGLFPLELMGHTNEYNAMDIPLWFIWSLQQLEKYTDVDIWKTYGKYVTQILNAYLNGTYFGIKMDDSGLIQASDHSLPLSWMDSVVFGQQVTPRKGYMVEINALWYNAICQIKVWTGGRGKIGALVKDLPERIKQSFVNTFWIEEKKYLADFVSHETKNVAVRPNQVIACSLDHSPLSTEMKKGVLDVVKSELLTHKGLRTLAPKNELYKGIYKGNQQIRDSVAHQGTVYPWLLEHFVYAYLAVHKKSGLSLVKKLYSGFEEDMTEHGIGTISELYDGNPPHDPKGAISYSGSVASLLRIGEIIEKY